MTRFASTRAAVFAACAVAFVLAGCNDDDDDSRDAAVDAVVPGQDAVVPVQDAVVQDADAFLTCEQRVAQDEPALSQACVECMCEECQSELDACWQDEECADQWACARDAVAEGTCAAGDQACLADECDYELTDPSAVVAECIDTNCEEQCVPVGEPDAGVDDNDNGGIIDNGLL
jgi:hypothetical protein